MTHQSLMLFSVSSESDGGKIKLFIAVQNLDSYQLIFLQKVVYFMLNVKRSTPAKCWIKYIKAGLKLM